MCDFGGFGGDLVMDDHQNEVQTMGANI